MTTTTQRLGARDLATGRVEQVGTLTTTGGGWTLHLTSRPGLSAHFPIGRLRPERGPNDAPRSWRRPR